MITAKDVYDAALAIMNETDSDNSYRTRTPAIINSLLPRCWQYTERYNGGSRSGWKPVCNITDRLFGIDDTVALGVMPYGLAAILYAGEDPVLANSWQQIFEEALYEARRIPKEFEPIEDVYGCVDHSYGSRW